MVRYRMENKLKKVFDFLNSNRKYNHDLQKRFYLSSMASYDTVSDKILSLLYDTVNSQSRSNIDNKSKFFKYVDKNKESLNSFESFVKHINKKPTDINYYSLFKGLESQGGWGEKTSALFVKNIFNLHNENYCSNELKIWDDVPNTIEESDKLYLPVDAVFKAIFKKINPSVKWDFNKINKEVGKYYEGKDIVVWDDLWYWGFITQNGSGDDRKHEWNENKYWMLKDAPKDKEIIKDIKQKAEIFLKILT